MRQALAWSLVGIVLVASLLACPLPAGAGDPDIPLAHTHLQRQAPGHGVAVAEVQAADQRADQQSIVVESPAPRVITLWRMIARWMIANAMRAGH